MDDRTMTRPAIVGAAALLLASCQAAPPPPAAAPAAPPGVLRLEEPPSFLETAPVEATAEGAVDATGRVTFDDARVSRVASPLSGRVVELVARPGDRVRRGQALLVIASPDAEDAVADLASAESDLQLAERALARARRLWEDQAVPMKDVQQAEGDAVKARSGVARARARLEVLGIDPAAPGARMARYVLKAPIEGVVVERPALPGMEVRADAGTPLVTVADLSRVWVLADLYERDLGRAMRGQRAEVRVPAYPGEVFSGPVTYVGEMVDPATRTVKIRVELPNPGTRLKPEMFARVSLAAGPGTPAALSVPAAAVVSDGAASAVVVALGDGRFERRTIEAGPEADGRVRVLAGLKPGERVVTGGALYLKTALDGR
jgi:cobalt-zinc-cadmium efflux system membrane fusion protein